MSKNIPESPFNNFLDYISWRGDLPFGELAPYNVLDSLVFARFSYLKFSAVGYGEIETIGSLCNEMKKLSEKRFLIPDDRTLATMLASAKRYKNFAVTDIVYNNDSAREKQFGGLTILLPNDELYISFIGTDDTLFGWKEDFNMTFMENVPSQLDAVEYLKHIAEKYPKHKIRLGGHSKGGNLAMYAALSASNELQDRILSVDNYDGPGFDQDRVDFNKNPKIISKITTYFPQESMIGRLFDHEEPSIVVESVEAGLMQHDVYSWRVDPSFNGFVKIKDAKQIKYVINKSLRAWVKDCTLEQRKIFIDTVYESIQGADFDSFSAIRKNPVKAIPPILKAYRSSTTPEDRKQINQIIKLFLKNYKAIRKSNDKVAEKANRAAHRTNINARKAKNKAAAKSGKTIPKVFF